MYCINCGVKLADTAEQFIRMAEEGTVSIDDMAEVRLLEVGEEWETHMGRVAEGPFVLKHKSIYYLTYSANHTRCRDYAVGVAMSKSPTGPFGKFKGNPILHRNDRFCGVGHHSFTTSRDGKTLICAYHCHDSLENFRPRRFCMNTAQFVAGADGMDELVINGPV